MAKKRLSQIASEYDISFETAQDIAFNCLAEESITGKGKNTWIDKVGQDLLDDNIPMAIQKARVYRGRIRNKAPNPRFCFVDIKEKGGCIPVEIPRKYKNYVMAGKFIHVEELEDDKYVMVVPNIV
tara:strand:- start:1829 stop:2206 length:378 start_codon:yes stop_codon:yes gene_type:complete